MPSEVPFIDIEACVASIPGTGEDAVAWTHTTDGKAYSAFPLKPSAPWKSPKQRTNQLLVAEFVSRAISMPPGTWKEHSWIVGDKVTFHQILAAAETARGVKFTVTYDSLDKLKKGEYTQIPANRAHADLYSTPEFDAMPVLIGMFAGIGAAMAQGNLDVPEEETLNALFPNIETVKVVQFIEKWWGGRGGA